LHLCELAIELDNKALTDGVSAFLQIPAKDDGFPETEDEEENRDPRPYEINDRILLRICNLATNTKCEWLLSICQELLHADDCDCFGSKVYCNFYFIPQDDFLEICTEESMIFITQISIQGYHFRDMLELLVEFFYPGEQKLKKIVPRASKIHPSEILHPMIDDLFETDNWFNHLTDSFIQKLIKIDLFSTERKMDIMFQRMNIVGCQMVIDRIFHGKKLKEKKEKERELVENLAKLEESIKEIIPDEKVQSTKRDK